MIVAQTLFIRELDGRRMLRAAAFANYSGVTRSGEVIRLTL
ncbi:hypothetical protein ACFVSU_03230 [Microbacterium sp. NPDC058062]